MNKREGGASPEETEEQEYRIWLSEIGRVEMIRQGIEEKFMTTDRGEARRDVLKKDVKDLEKALERTGRALADWVNAMKATGTESE